MRATVNERSPVRRYLVAAALTALLASPAIARPVSEQLGVPGDTVVVRRQDTARDGEIVVAAVEGEASGAARAIDSDAESASARSGPNPAKMKYKINRIALNRQDPGYSVLRSRFITLSV